MNSRYYLYYLLGFLPSIFFASRFFIQWIQSETKKKSHVTPLFWELSITGNLLLALHYFIQFQYYFLMIQIINAFISWRNLNFLQKKKVPYSLAKALLILSVALGVTAFFCVCQNLISNDKPTLFGPPQGIVSEKADASFLWTFCGTFGAALFASRFWIQWIQAERDKNSFFSSYFWIVSLVGSLFCLLYFIRILDWVSIANYSFGIVPYLRNLILLRSHLKESAHANEPSTQP